MTIASIPSDLCRGGAFEAHPPQAEELQKCPGGIGLKQVEYFDKSDKNIWSFFFQIGKKNVHMQFLSPMQALGALGCD